MREWSITMRLEYNAVVTVHAETAEEAKAMAKRTDWVDDGMAGAELVNWEVHSQPKDEGECEI